MMGNLMNEHDMTKKMLDTLRENVNEPNADGVIEVSGPERQSAEEEFKQIVEVQRVDFNVYNVYPEAGNVIFGGQMQEFGGMQFQMTLEDTNGLFISANNMVLSDDAVRMLQRLNGFYDKWRSDADKLLGEYRKQG